jgi:hypothetical protein
MVVKRTGQMLLQHVGHVILKKGSKNTKEINMFPLIKPIPPTSQILKNNGKNFPPNYLHESWRDFLYWDSELENTN